MNTYRVFKHESKGYSAIKEGFSWPAFLFTGLWVLYNRLWLQGAALLGIGFAIGLFIPRWFPERHFPFMAVLYGGISLFFGLAGNEWRSDRRLEDGYQQVGELRVRNAGEAVTAFRESTGDVDPLHRAALPGGIEITPDGTYSVRGRIFSKKEDAIRHHRSTS